MSEFSLRHGRNVTVAALAAASCAACTHLQTNPTGEVPSIAPGQSASAGAQRGISYALPMLQYNLEITYSLTSCPDNGPPVIAAKVNAQERYVAGERFEVDYQAMSSPFKTTGFDISYHESGTIRTINARAQDQTGTVLTNVARIGLAAAGVATGNPLAAMTLAAPGPQAWSSDPNSLAGKAQTSAAAARGMLDLRCSDATKLALAQLQSARNDVKTLTETVTDLTERVTRFGAMAALRVLSRPDRVALSQAVGRLLDAERALRAAMARVATLQAGLSATEQRYWPSQTGDNPADPDTITPNDETVDKLINLLEVQLVEPGQGGQRQRPLQSIILREARADLQAILVVCPNARAPRPALTCLAEQVRERTALNLRLQPTVTHDATQSTQRRSGNGLTADGPVIVPGDRRWARGIFVREPVEARLIVCAAPGVVRDAGCSDRQEPTLRGGPLIAPQLGRLRLLPFRSRAFENNHLQLSVRSNGFIEQFSYGEESSAAAASGALADIAERTQTALEAMETERRSDIQYARESRTYERTEAAAIRAEELAQLTQQVNLVKGQSDLLAAQIANSVATDTQNLAAEKARLDAELAILQAQLTRLRTIAEIAAATQPVP